MTEPVFVVVGRSNLGKSSVVSTLAEDDSVRIESSPGTTQHCRRYPLKEGDRVLLTLVDTPGFESARRALAWMRGHVRSTADRADTVRRFIEAHHADPAFAKECRLLAPIMKGGAILYVVDSSTPYASNYEAEMEILQWTGQPRMALINRKRKSESDYTDEWRPVLGQYLSAVREFDAREAVFNDRLQLLRTLRELNDSWSADIEEAIRCLIERRRHMEREAADEIADMLLDMLCLVKEQRLPGAASGRKPQDKLKREYFEALRRRERAAYRAIRRIYLHHRLDVKTEELTVSGEDLFDTERWKALGLTRKQLVTAGAAGGALVGGALDAAVLGADFLLGTVIGATTGAVASISGMTRLPDVKILGRPLAGKVCRIGPIKNPQFPWIVLDRALLVHRAFQCSAHARRETLTLSSDQTGSLVRDLDEDLRRRIGSQFQRLQRKKTLGRDTVSSARRELPELIAAAVAACREPADEPDVER